MKSGAGRTGSSADAARLFLLGAAALFWELALIRWMGACIRIVGYYTNFILLASFLGLGAGALLARRRVQLRSLLVPALALCIVAGPVLGAFAHPNPTSGEYLWTGTFISENLAFLGVRTVVALPYGLLLAAAFLLTAFVFLVVGQWLGVLFGAFEALTAYSIEIAGSLLGILLFALMSLLSLPPTAWFGVGFALLVPILGARLGPWLVAAACVLPALLFCRGFEGQFSWSPYYKIKIEPLYGPLDAGPTRGRLAGYDLTVNSDFHQKVIDLRPRQGESPFFQLWRAIYEYPYRDPAGVRGPTLVVGAGTGNDLSAALRRTDTPVVAVEIDPVILRLGHEIHPERPYADPRVRAVNQDARAFFARGEETYARVVFGYLDSHTLFSAFSTLRLDNFVYTVESLARVKELLLPGGRVYLTFSTNTLWIDQRLEGMLDQVFDYKTVTVSAPPGPFLGTVTYVNGKRAPGEPPAPPRTAPSLRLPSDDWPYLYLKEATVPAHYAWFLALVLVSSAGSLWLLPGGERRIKLPYFFLGAAFFLIETSNVVKLALLFGSTWMVNVAVFAGILVLVLLGNLVARRLPGEGLGGLFAVLFAACAVSYFVRPAQLLPIDSPLLRGAAAVLLFLSPVFVASLIFARLIRRELSFYAAYGSNLLGAMVGGAAEYFSLVFGLQSLVLLSAAFYGLAFLTSPRGRG